MWVGHGALDLENRGPRLYTEMTRQQCRTSLGQAGVRLRRQIQRKRVDGTGSELVRVELKTKKSRRPLPLPIVCAVALDTRRLAQHGEWVIGNGLWNARDPVFTIRDGTLWELWNVNRAFEIICEKAKIRPVRVHDARHGFASLLRPRESSCPRSWRSWGTAGYP